MRRRTTIALAAPALEDRGGVRAVAEFLLRTIRRRTDLDVSLISLATSSRDPASLLLHRPSTWWRGVGTRRGLLAGEPFVHVGAFAGELEFQRYRPRTELDALISECDLVQVVAGSPAAALPFVGRGKPVALQVATLAEVERRRMLGGPAGPFRRWRRLMTAVTSACDRQALAAADAVLVENRWMLAHVRTISKPGAIVRLAPPGIDPELFAPRAEAALTRRGHILSVGRFSDPRKNAPLLLEAYARLALRFPEAPGLILAGSAAPDASFHRRAARLGLSDRVSLRIGPGLHELAALYRDALCFVLASDEEGFGMVVIEAMASGLPVIATRCGGPDDIIADGVDGFLVERGDGEAIAVRLHALLSQPRLRLEMGRAARRTVEQRYTEEAAGEAFLDVYDRLLEGPSRRQPLAHRSDPLGMPS